jgi:hypothetical protein
MNKFLLPAVVLAFSLAFLCSCKKEDEPNEPVVIPPKNEVEGSWQNIRTAFYENIKGQTVIVDELTIDYEFAHTTYTEKQTFEGRLASDNVTAITEVRTKTATYQLMSGYIKSTITKFEIDGEAIADKTGLVRYYFYEMPANNQMQLSEAQPSVRLSGVEGNMDNSSFYFSDSTYTADGFYSYNHINLLFSNNAIYEYTQVTTSREMPSWNAGTFYSCPVQIYSNYYIRVEEPPVHVPYMFINSVLYNGKPMNAPENLFLKK